MEREACSAYGPKNPSSITRLCFLACHNYNYRHKSDRNDRKRAAARDEKLEFTECIGEPGRASLSWPSDSSTTGTCDPAPRIDTRRSVRLGLERVSAAWKTLVAQQAKRESTKKKHQKTSKNTGQILDIQTNPLTRVAGLS